MRIAFGLTEPNHGSDATWMETRGVRDGDHWRITGAKMWNTGLTSRRMISFSRAPADGRQSARHHLLHRADQERGFQNRRISLDLQHADRPSASLAH